MSSRTETEPLLSVQPTPRSVYVAFFFAALGGFLFGFDIGATSQANVLIKNQFDLNKKETKEIFLDSVIVSLSLVGALLATLLLFQIADGLGRKKELIIGGFLYIIGAVIQFVSHYVGLWLLMVGRTVYGLGIGFAMHAAPLYIAEISPAHIRGKLISTKEVFIVFGILTGYLVGLIFHHPTKCPDNAKGGWEWMYLCALLFAIPMTVGVSFTPESPRWLALSTLTRNGSKEEALRTLTKLRSDEREAKEELEEVLESLSQQQSGTWGELFKAKLPLLVGTGLVCFQQITGQPSVLYYASTIFQQAFEGKKGDCDANSSALVVFIPFIASAVVGLVKALATLGTVFSVDKRGRKTLLFIGIGMMIVSLLGLGFLNLNIYGDVSQKTSKLIGYITLACLMLYVSGYQVGFGPISWLMISEIFPLSIRGKALSIAVVTNFAFNIIIAMTITYLFDAIGNAATYFIYGGIAVVSIIFVWGIVPETKGKSLEQIEDMFRQLAGGPDRNPHL